MRKVLIVTGPGGDAQGWGDMKVTETMCETLNAGESGGRDCLCRDRG